MGSLYIGENLLDSVAISYDTEDTPTNGSKKPLSSGGAYTAIEALEAVLADKDTVPTSGSTKPLTSGGAYNEFIKYENRIESIFDLHKPCIARIFMHCCDIRPL